MIMKTLILLVEWRPVSWGFIEEYGEGAALLPSNQINR